MGCLHATTCPLFPLLNASLHGWRDYYCDSADGWRGCARYQHSLTGTPVPITLLPNGVHAQHLRRAAAPWPARSPASPRPRPGPHVPESPATGPARPRRRWWTRLADWISGPA